MITAGDLRKGVTFEYEGKVYVVVDFMHVKPGKGAAFVRTKLKNVITGQVIELTFNPVTKFEKAQIETKQMQYLYSDGDLYYFMDNETYEQLPLNHDQVEDALQFIVENMDVTVRFYKGEAFSICNFLFGRFSAEFLHQCTGNAVGLIDDFRHVNRNTDGTGLVCNCSGNCLTDPPGSIGGEFIALCVVEFFYSFNQAQITFLDEVKERKSAAYISLCDADNETQVGFGKHSLCNFIAFFNFLSKLNFFFQC